MIVAGTKNVMSMSEDLWCNVLRVIYSLRTVYNLPSLTSDGIKKVIKQFLECFINWNVTQTKINNVFSSYIFLDARQTNYITFVDFHNFYNTPQPSKSLQSPINNGTTFVAIKWILMCYDDMFCWKYPSPSAYLFALWSVRTATWFPSIRSVDSINRNRHRLWL